MHPGVVGGDDAGRVVFFGVIVVDVLGPMGFIACTFNGNSAGLSFRFGKLIYPLLRPVSALTYPLPGF